MEANNNQAHQCLLLKDSEGLRDQTGRVRQSLVGDCFFVLTVKG